MQRVNFWVLSNERKHLSIVYLSIAIRRFESYKIDSSFFFKIRSQDGGKSINFDPFHSFNVQTMFSEIQFCFALIWFFDDINLKHNVQFLHLKEKMLNCNLLNKCIQNVYIQINTKSYFRKGSSPVRNL